MQVTFVRIDLDGRYATRIQRDDGVRFSIQGIGHNFEIPHDLAHFVVEQALDFDTGFWGTIAEGGVFPSMIYEGGRRKPKAAERSRAIMKANARRQVEAEILVSVFGEAIMEGHAETSPILRRRLRERLPMLEREITALKIADTYSSYHRVLADWTVLGVGEGMCLIWSGRGSSEQLRR
jgi:hypothetical protein